MNKKAETLRQEEKVLAEKESFLAFLNDKETIQEAIVEFENAGNIRPNLKLAIKHFKETEQVNGILENRLKIWFRSDASNEQCK